MTNRRELFHVISEMCNEMRRKLETDFERVSVDGWTTCWQFIPPADDEEAADKPAIRKSQARLLTKDDDSDRVVGFNPMASCGFRFGTERLKIEVSNDRYKQITILSLSSLAEGKQTSLRTDIKWYDRLRPTWWKMNNTIKLARRVRVSHQAINIEKDLAKMIPDRIDNILFGGSNDAKT